MISESFLRPRVDRRVRYAILSGGLLLCLFLGVLIGQDSRLLLPFILVLIFAAILAFALTQPVRYLILLAAANILIPVNTGWRPASSLPEISIMRFLILIAIIAWGIRHVSQKDRNDIENPLRMPVIVIALSILISTIFSINHQRSLYKAISYLAEDFLLFLAFVDILQSREQANKLLTAMIIVTSAISLIGLVETFTGWQYVDTFRSLLELSQIDLSSPLRLGIVRAKASAEHAIHFGAQILFILPFVWLRLRQSSTFASKFAYLLIFGIQLFAVILTLSRGAWIGLIVALALLQWGKYSGRSLMLIVAAVIIVLAFSFVPYLSNLGFAPLLSVRALADSGEYAHPLSRNLTGRIAMLLGMLNAFTQRPLIGHGLATLSPFGGGEYVDISYSALGRDFWYANDNFYAQWVVEVGLVGTIALSWLLWCSVRMSNTACWFSTGREREFFFALRASIIAFLVQNIFASILSVPQQAFVFWLLLAILVRFSPRWQTRIDSSPSTVSAAS